MWVKEEGLGPIKIIKHHHSVKKFQTPSVSRRNARERNRVKQVNSGFNVLKDHVPHLKNKTSKVNVVNIDQLSRKILEAGGLYQLFLHIILNWGNI